VSVLRDHIVLMFLYAAATALYFALLWRETRGERIRSFLVIFCSLFFGGILIGWAMFPFPQILR
jgi:Flp pilus assembly protein TadB